ncbi:MAG: FAD-dependent oxidoreductase [Epsilonproteobacteria bacterium]|nr:FAD-dependent oxidoreductase [Campylobacterota bacterium]
MQISKKSLFDFAIVGAGISGACTAYFLKKYGKKVIVIDKDKIASGGSGVAGAFLSPKIGSNSLYTQFINKSFEFSIKFYEKNFPQFLDKSGILRVLKSENDIKKCKQHEAYIPKNFQYLQSCKITNLRKEACKYGGYFFNDGAVIDAKGVINHLLKDIKVLENNKIDDFSLNGDGYYELGDIKAKGIVICAGNSGHLELKYLGFKNIYGHRLDIKTTTKLPTHMHKAYSISASKKGLVHIGATHIPSYIYDEKDDYYDKINEMINLAKSYVYFDDFEVQDIHLGVRNSTTDFFPIIGKVINAKETLDKYPYIKKGSLVPKEKYIYYSNMYINAGLGARGFIIAPKTAENLAKYLCNNDKIDKRLDTARLFLKFAKKKD